MSAWMASLEPVELRRRFEEDEEEFDDGFSFDDEDEEEFEDDELDEDEEDFELEEEDDLDNLGFEEEE